MTIRSILVGTDFSAYARHAALRAGRLARELGVTRTVLMHVAPRFAFSAGDRTRTRRALRAELTRAAAEVEAKTGTAFAARLEQGGVLAVLTSVATRFDLLVLGAQGQHPLRDFAFGTTAERLLRRVHCPVLFVKVKPTAPYRDVLVPVDFSNDAGAALELARVLAPRAQLSALHAFEVPFEGKLRAAGVTEDHVLAYRREARARALTRMRAALRPFGERTSALIVHGYPPHVIARTQPEIGADLVAIGKHGRTALEDLLLGSVTLRTLASVSCDVLVALAPGDRMRRRRD
jgi:nucleotide-binding universal stress UspA family protein